MAVFVNRLNRRNFVIYCSLISIILVFLPWIVLYFYLNSKGLIYSGLKYGGVAIVISSIASIFYDKNKKIVFWLTILILFVLILIALKNLFLAVFFTGLGPWTLG